MMLKPALRPPLRAPMRGATTLGKGGGVYPIIGNDEDEMASDAFAQFWAAIDAGVSPTILMVADSTQDGTTDPFYRLLNEKIGPQKPDVCIRYQVWDDTAQKFGAWTTMRAGAAGQRHVVMDGANAIRVYQGDILAAVSADLEYETKLSLDDWTPGSIRRLAGRLGGGGNQGWYCGINTNGTPFLSWSADGTILITVTRTQQALTDAAAYTLRFRLDVDNGGGGYTADIDYSADDGANWTSLYHNVGSGGTTSIFNTTADLQVGSASGSGAFTGKIYSAVLRDGIAGPARTPLSIEDFYAGDTALTPWGGSVTIYAQNASMSGQGIAYFDDSTRRPKIAQQSSAHMTIIALGHNDVVNRTPGVQQTAMGTLLTNLRTRLPTSSFVGTDQNPRNTAQTAGKNNSDTHRTLALSLGGIFQRAAAGFVSTYRAFIRAYAGGALPADLVADGVHPTTPAGVDIWINEFWRVMSQRTSY